MVCLRSSSRWTSAARKTAGFTLHTRRPCLQPCPPPAALKQHLIHGPCLRDLSTSQRLGLPHGSSEGGRNASQQLLDEFKSSSDIGTDVVVHGYLGSLRNLSKTISFSAIVSADQEHSLQIISNSESAQGGGARIHEALKRQSPNSPVAITGHCQAKNKPGKPSTSSGVKPNAKGPRHNEDIELLLRDLRVLNLFPSSVTFKEGTVFSPDQRHLQIRRDDTLRHSLLTRAQIAATCRDFLGKTEGFMEIETPILFKSTPEGAREFLVPTRRRGYAYALPQSPQQYKQILMASGISKYYQLARCFRDEDLRADRQPEFTQLDLEMAFATGQDVMQTVESLVRLLWSRFQDLALPEGPFPRMTYEQAMTRFGSDKPDTRLGMEIARIEHIVPTDLIGKIGPLDDPIVEAIQIEMSGQSKNARDLITEFMAAPEAREFLQNPEGQPGIFIYDPRRPMSGLHGFDFEATARMEELFSLEAGDILVIQARKRGPFTGGSTALGRLRLALHKMAVAERYLEEPQGWSILWIEGFPLFSPATAAEPGQGGATGLASTHHPFTAPASEADLELMATDPLAARADHYDLVLNGVELGGGSRRVHDARLQEYILREVLGVGERGMDDFAHLLAVLAAGCPPHAGFALGFDRLCAVLLGRDSIRDVIAFPKSGRGEDLVVRSPSATTPEQLRTYHLKPA